MHILKLPWFGHKTENKQIECYSVTSNADGTRLASGGLDGNVKIWDTSTVAAFASKKPKEELPPDNLRRPLCSMSRHNGVVTCVKFSPDGRFLASGSDDKICLIWEKDEEQLNRPKQFGELEADLEHWTVRKRLVAHDNDIQDICWSPDGLLLVTVGLDRLIIIWNGLTFERIKRYDIHQSMVKGIVFDPANKFFATASDDRTVRIFRYYRKLNGANNIEFQMEHIVLDPFKKSPLTSYFRRMSWSPDGQHIAVPNATNGPVASVAIINRGTWATDISLIGHEAPCEVCAFSPRLFKSTDKKEDAFSTVLATAGQDRNLAIWSTARSRPLLLAQEIASNSITDMCWLPDGATLYLCCLDGSITCILFEANELGNVVEGDSLEVLNKFGADRESAIFPESIEQLQLEDKADDRPDTVIAPPQPKVEVKRTPFDVPQEQYPKHNVLAPKKVNKLTQNVTITKAGKKRVAPLLVSTTSSKTAFVSTGMFKSSKKSSSKISQLSYYLPRLGIQTSVHGIKPRSITNQYMPNQENEDQDNDNEDMGIDETNVTPVNTVSDASLKRQRNKLKRAIIEMRYPNCFKVISNLPEVLFNNQSVVNQQINHILGTITTSSKEYQADLSSFSSVDVDEDLMFSVVINSVRHEVDENKLVGVDASADVVTTIEVRNGQPWPKYEDETVYCDKIDFNDATRVIITNTTASRDRQFILYFPYKIQHAVPVVVDAKLVMFALISFHGTLQLVSAMTGRYTSPSFELGVNVVAAKHAGGYLMVLTSSGLIWTWQVQKMVGVVQAVSMAPILNNYDAAEPVLASVSAIEINPDDGSPYVVLNHTHDIYNYSLELECWVKTVDSWYYQAIDTVPRGDGVLPRMVERAFGEFQEDVKRQRINSYALEAGELKQVMEARGRHEIDEKI